MGVVAIHQLVVVWTLGFRVSQERVLVTNKSGRG